MARAHWKRFTLDFKRPSGTSRGVLNQKTSYFLIWEDESFAIPALGECSLIEGLSPDPMESFESVLDQVSDHLNGEESDLPDLKMYPSIQMGLETLNLDIEAKGTKVLYPSSFTQGAQGMLINGLVWMGDKDFMRQQIIDKIELGFECVKLKIGAIDFDTELSILAYIRSEFGVAIELRVDANGAFSTDSALERLKRLSEFDLHSIEQPIRQGQWEEMAELCEVTPLPIALDEELIGVHEPEVRKRLLETIRPQYIILKPSLHGGLSGSENWIDLANEAGIDWWITSALESNVGLNSIAQFAFQKEVTIPQGLGTGGLYTNNFDSPLYLQGQIIRYNPFKNWDLEALLS